jgi:hypothetical protein
MFSIDYFENRLVIPEMQYTNGLTFSPPFSGFIPAKNGTQLHQPTKKIRRVAMYESYRDSN